MSTSDGELVLIPALATDARVLAPHVVAFPQAYVPSWIEPEKNESLRDYAGRLIERFPNKRPRIVGGVSLGGMLAWEVAARLRPEAVVLVASCRSPKSIGRFFQVAHPLLRVIPPQLIEATKPLAPLAVKMFVGPWRKGVLTVRERSADGPHVDGLAPGQSILPLLVSMYRDTPARLLRWSIQAIFRWQPSVLDGVRVYHIHGGRDRMIPAHRVTPDRLVPDAGHFVNLTHPDEVNDYLAEVLRGATGH